MARTIAVIIERLGGDELELSLDVDMSINDVKVAVASKLNIRKSGFHLVDGKTVLKGSQTLESVANTPERLEGQLRLSMMQVDPLPDLAKFDYDHGRHQGLFVVNSQRPEDYSKLVKTAIYPDSSAANVLVSHRVREPCFVEFRIVHTRGEMSFGVTPNPTQVLDAYGHANRKLNCTWLYGKRNPSTAVWLLGGVSRQKDGEAFQQNDLVTVYVDPENKQVQFYRNGELISDNLPKYPLPEFCADEPWRIYAMVHLAHDEVQIERFGPGEPFEDKIKAPEPVGPGPAATGAEGGAIIEC